jgi:predicted PurR-regulated permease PerM
MSNPTSDVPRIILLALFIALLIVGTFWTLLPFLGALIWATTIAIATWPVLLWLQRHLGNRRGYATTVMTLFVALVFTAPFLLAISTLVDTASRSPAVLRDFVSNGLSPPPSWVSSIPFVGERLASRWQEFSAAEPEVLVQSLRPYAASFGTWVLAATGGVGATLVQMLLILILLAVLYSSGETAARGMLAFGSRLGGEQGRATLALAAKAIRSVALGVIVTALVQSILAGLGLWFSGIPHPGVLTAVAFVLGVAQLGPLLVLAPAVGWLFWSGSTASATILLIWSVPVIAMDNVLRPILIRKGVELPMLLIIAGVIGGLIGFGVLGLFVGPVILAASYTLMGSWIGRHLDAEKARSQQPEPETAISEASDAATLNGEPLRNLPLQQ